MSTNNDTDRGRESIEMLTDTSARAEADGGERLLSADGEFDELVHQNRGGVS